MATSSGLRTTRNLIALERGPEELILVNSLHMRPLYVKRGRDRVRKVLSAASSGMTPAGLREAFPEDDALIQLLSDHHLLLRTDEAEDAAVATDAAPPTPKRRITLYLLLSESCNLACVYCLNGPGTYRKDGRSRMSAEVAFRGVEMGLKEAAPGGAVEVAFFGGEPLLHWSLVKEVIAHCEDVLGPRYPDRTIHYHLTSNLTLAPPDLVEVVTRHGMSIVCGVDGPPDIHDRCRPYPGGGASHDRTAATIRKLVQAGARVTLRTTITSANHARLEETADHHAGFGACDSLFVPVRPINSDRAILQPDLLPDPDRIVAAALTLRRRGGRANLFPFNDFTADIRPGVHHVVACGAPRGTTYVVQADGDVYPCIYLVGWEQYRLGNVAGALNLKPLDDMLEALHVDRREECRSCAWRYACGGGCPVMVLARATAMDPNNPKPRVAEYARRITCELSQAILADALWDLADGASEKATT
jgi:uncharacterized protein